MSRPSKCDQPANRNIPEAFFDDLLGYGLSHSQWETRFRDNNYLWNDAVKNKMIRKEREWFKEEIQRLQAQPNTAGIMRRYKTNSLESILKRLKGEEWVKGIPDEKEIRFQERRLMGKDAKSRQLQLNAKKWKNLPSAVTSHTAAAEEIPPNSYNPQPSMTLNSSNVKSSLDASPHQTRTDQVGISQALDFMPDFLDLGILPNASLQTTCPQYQWDDQPVDPGNHIEAVDPELPAFLDRGMFSDSDRPLSRQLSGTLIYDMMSRQNLQGIPSETPLQSDPYPRIESTYQSQTSNIISTDGDGDGDSNIHWSDWVNNDNEACSTNQVIQLEPAASGGTIQISPVPADVSSNALETHPSSLDYDTEMGDGDDIDLSGSNALGDNMQSDAARRRNRTNSQPTRNRYQTILARHLVRMKEERQSLIKQIQRLELEKNAALRSEAECRKTKEIAEAKYQELHEKIESSQNAVKRISRQIEDTAMAETLPIQDTPITPTTPTTLEFDGDSDQMQTQRCYAIGGSPMALTRYGPGRSADSSRLPSAGNNNLTVHRPIPRSRSHSGQSSSGLSDNNYLSVQDVTGRDRSHSHGTSSSENSSASGTLKQLGRKISNTFLGKTIQEHKKVATSQMPISRPSTAVPKHEKQREHSLPASRQLSEIQNRDSGYVSQASPRASVADKE